MADVQKYFTKFHAAIRLDAGDNSELAAKRDIILNKVRESLKEKKRPTFELILQGSYAVSTGIWALNNEYDIDVGLNFNVKDSEYKASEVRKWVFEAVDGHTDSVDEKGPCIRVAYAKGFYVDVVCYAKNTEWLSSAPLVLAHRGKGWLKSDPVALRTYIEKATERFKDTKVDGIDQLRRVIRYLKRWSDFVGPIAGKDQPSGLAYTLLAINTLSPKLKPDGSPDDRAAVYEIAKKATDSWGNISAKKPTPEYEDMFGMFSDDQNRQLKDAFRRLADKLTASDTLVDPTDACTELAKVFGKDFPVPERPEGAKIDAAPAIITSSSSA